MTKYDEAQMLFVITEEFGKIVQDLGTALHPHVPSGTQATLQELNARLLKLQQVAVAYVIPPAQLAELRAALQTLLNS